MRHGVIDLPLLTLLLLLLPGVGSYRINEREVTGEAYEGTLKQIGVLVKVGRAEGRHQQRREEREG